VALRRIYGTETEYGIIHRGVKDSNPISASSFLINAYLSKISNPGVGPGSPRVGWDFIDETPGIDIRGFAPIGSLPPEIEPNLVNAVLVNGSRYYVDHAHPELSTPECLDPLSLLKWDRAGDEILIKSMAAANEVLPAGEELIVYKNNSDGKGNSYGCHENYLLSRETPFGRIVQHATTHFVTRQIFTGAGKVGSEAVGEKRMEIPFQLTQRADFFEEEVGLETTLKRPIINTRDEPHADPLKYRRLHVIVGDANLCEVATFLKLGTTGIIMAMIEDDFLDNQLKIADPVRALREVSRDLSLDTPILLEGGKTATALSLQWELFERSHKYLNEFGFENVGGETVRTVMDYWEKILSALSSNPDQLFGFLDWVTKKKIIDSYTERHDLEVNDYKLAALDLQYHDLRPEMSLFSRVAAEKIVSFEEVALAVENPPEETRAFFRGKCLQKWPDKVLVANWDSIVFDTGDQNLQRVLMMEPLKGTSQHVGDLIDRCETVIELIESMSGTI
jgi:proteasome accessory factor A